MKRLCAVKRAAPWPGHSCGGVPVQLRIIARDGRALSVDVLEVPGLEAADVGQCSLVTCQPLPPGALCCCSGWYEAGQLLPGKACRWRDLPACPAASWVQISRSSHLLACGSVGTRHLQALCIHGLFPLALGMCSICTQAAQQEAPCTAGILTPASLCQLCLALPPSSLYERSR